jgi:hypothetical protein
MIGNWRRLQPMRAFVAFRSQRGSVAVAALAPVPWGEVGLRSSNVFQKGFLQVGECCDGLPLFYCTLAWCGSTHEDAVPISLLLVCRVTAPALCTLFSRACRTLFCGLKFLLLVRCLLFRQIRGLADAAGESVNESTTIAGTFSIDNTESDLNEMFSPASAASGKCHFSCALELSRC